MSSRGRLLLQWIPRPRMTRRTSTPTVAMIRSGSLLRAKTRTTSSRTRSGSLSRTRCSSSWSTSYRSNSARKAAKNDLLSPSKLWNSTDPRRIFGASSTARCSTLGLFCGARPSIQAARASSLGSSVWEVRAPTNASSDGTIPRATPFEEHRTTSSGTWKAMYPRIDWRSALVLLLWRRQKTVAASPDSLHGEPRGAPQNIYVACQRRA
mmetsp:Transcript_44921/g.143915  ORF Transcript_44921/g.143915 Transcript_44921/m.143915 type:complete len:209 (+) Transcript_44921:205-831(+)